MSSPPVGGTDPRWRRLDAILSGLEREFEREIAMLTGAAARGAVAAIDGAELGIELLNSPPRAIGDVGLGAIDADVNPLGQLRGGRSYGRATVSGELAGHATISPHVAFAAHLRSVTGDEGAARSEPDVAVQALTIRAGMRNVFVQAGRQPIAYGQGIWGGPFATRNAPGLDMIRVGNDLPARLPWVLARLGPARGAFFVADLGHDQHFPHTKLAGWKMSFLPTASLEVGASLLSQQAGRGAPSARFHERVIDVLTIIDVVFLQDRDLLFSNKLAGLDVRWRGAAIELYFDGMVDDFDVRRLMKSLWEDAGYATGFALPELGRDGAVRVEAEFQHTGLRYYQHAQFQSGVTARGHIIGLPIGPRADGLLARVQVDRGTGAQAWVTGAVERRSDDRYMTAFGENDAGFRFVKTLDLPEEMRVRLVAGGGREVGEGGLRLEAQAGIEHVANDRFVAGASRLNTSLRLALVSGFH